MAEHRVGDKIPDPRDDVTNDAPYTAPDDLHPMSLAAFEDWCRRTHNDGALRSIDRYRRDVEKHRPPRDDD